MTRAPSFTQFARDVIGAELTPAQRVLALIAFDALDPIDLKPAEREIARDLFGDVERIPNGARHVLAVIAGARSGKTLLGSWRLGHLALTAPLTSLAPGERASGVIVAPDQRLSRQALRFALGAFENAPTLRRLITDSAVDNFTIRRPDRRLVTIECLPATRGGSAVRGRTLAAALLDEACFFRDEASVVNDADLFGAIAPRVVLGGQVVVVSTPWAESGLVFELWREQFGNPRTALVAHAPTVLMRPDQAAHVEREEQRDAINASREFGAEFLAAGGGLFFDSAAIEQAIDRARRAPLAPRPGTRAVAAADFAFSQDHSALVIVRANGSKLELADWLELRPTRDNPLKPSEVVERFAAVCKSHGCSDLVSDQHYSQSIREHLARARLGFLPAPAGLAGKMQSYKAAQSLLLERRAVLPDLPRLAQQLRDVQVRPLPGGGMSITHPRRTGAGHGDLAAALVLALASGARLLESPEVYGASVGKSRLASAALGESISRTGWGGY